MSDTKPATQLYLATPPLRAGDPFLADLKAVLALGPVACVLVHADAADDLSAKKIIREAATIIQPTGAAVLVGGWSDIVARAGADGLHLADGRKGLAEALETHQPDRIVGVGGIRSRHDAMAVAERGVDYVMFGEPSGDGRTPPLDAVVERTQWWADLFEVPCVAYAPDLASVPLLADCGADFVALGPGLFRHRDGAAAAMRMASEILAQRGE